VVGGGIFRAKAAKWAKENDLSTYSFGFLRVFRATQEMISTYTITRRSARLRAIVLCGLMWLHLAAGGLNVLPPALSNN